MVAYPALFSPEADGGFSVTFPDLPEANAFVDDLKGTLRSAMYGLAVALEFRIRDGEAWPRPSPALEGERVIALPVLIEAKLALIRDTYTALHDESMAIRAEWLEAAIVALIVLEIVMAFVFT